MLKGNPIGDHGRADLDVLRTFAERSVGIQAQGVFKTRKHLHVRACTCEGEKLVRYILQISKPIYGTCTDTDLCVRRLCNGPGYPVFQLMRGLVRICVYEIPNSSGRHMQWGLTMDNRIHT